MWTELEDEDQDVSICKKNNLRVAIDLMWDLFVIIMDKALPPPASLRNAYNIYWKSFLCQTYSDSFSTIRWIIRTITEHKVRNLQSSNSFRSPSLKGGLHAICLQCAIVPVVLVVATLSVVEQERTRRHEQKRDHHQIPVLHLKRDKLDIGLIKRDYTIHYIFICHWYNQVLDRLYCNYHHDTLALAVPLVLTMFYPVH